MSSARWPQVALAIVGILVPIVTALQAWTFAYVVSIEHRLTRVETIDELRRRPALKTDADPELIVPLRRVELPRCDAGEEWAAPRVRHEIRRD